MLSFWCEVAGLDLGGVTVRARTLMAGYDAGPPGAMTIRAVEVGKEDDDV